MKKEEFRYIINQKREKIKHLKLKDNDYKQITIITNSMFNNKKNKIAATWSYENKTNKEAVAKLTKNYVVEEEIQ